MKHPVILFVLLLVASIAAAERYTVRTETERKESRFDALCPILNAEQDESRLWTVDRCADAFFELGMGVFNDTVSKQNARRIYDRSMRTGKWQVVANPPVPTATPTATPTTTPTATPTPTP